jgi:hypothetical protein
MFVRSVPDSSIVPDGNGCSAGVVYVLLGNLDLRKRKGLCFQRTEGGPRGRSVSLLGLYMCDVGLSHAKSHRDFHFQAEPGQLQSPGLTLWFVSL